MITDIFDKSSVIESERLLLRPMNEKDAADLFEFWSDEQVMEYYDVLPLRDLSDAERQIRFFMDSFSSRTMIRWGIEYKPDNKIIGTCGFFSFSEENKKAGMGYELSKAYWGAGIMSEALSLILRHIFAETDINRIEAFTDVPNTASRKLLKRLGFTEEGILRQYERCRGGLIDVVIYSCLRSDGVYSETEK